ncbi:SDR family oxidoreductase [Sphingobium sp. DC-2]|uniref:SDR family NAD(P)-dependent oxidoreductase n=1 Tax=Sphingobium sp. DC-2 TaxID=1303256 RepID=UPI000689CEF1|nr:SDR family oxidoreductase [Sphingobium sp. DC-2]
MAEYKDKLAYITGSASGIGRGLALAFAKRGSALALADVSEAGLEETKALALAAGAPKVTTHLCDVSAIHQIERVAKEVLDAHGDVHFLCANAGIGIAGIPFSSVTQREVRWVMDVNTIGVYETVRSLLPSMLAHGQPGHILCTSSLAGLLTPPGWHHGIYSASKFGVAALAQGMRDEIGDRPIKVSSIYPGMVRTNISNTFRSLRPTGGVAPQLPEGLDMNVAIPPEQAAEIILAAAEAGVEDICTHPDEAREMHEAYSQRVKAGIAASAAAIERLSKAEAELPA